MPHIPKLLNALSRLLRYPDEYAAQTSELVFVILQNTLPEAARAASQFGTFVEHHELWEVEEAFTRTFDVNPSCALEVGWHLFGEEYARGMFLVRMREEMRKYGLPESCELPDHISHVLAVLAAMPELEASRFARACVQPAVAIMNQALSEKQSPYAPVVACLDAVLTTTWGAKDGAGDDRSRYSPADGADLLRDFPVADVDCRSGCDPACADDVQFVPLQIGYPDAVAPVNSHESAEVKRP